jgi:hypothetical protein
MEIELLCQQGKTGEFSQTGASGNEFIKAVDQYSCIEKYILVN